MIAFTVKKSLFDAWDSFMGLALVNLSFVAVAAAFILPAAALGPGLAGNLLLALGFLAFELCRVAATIALEPLAEGGSISFRAWFAAWPAAVPTALILGGVELALFLALSVAFPFYLGLGGVIGSFALGAVLWSSALVLLGLQWLPAAAARMPGRTLGARLKASFAMLLDNLGFTLFVTVWELLSLALSIFTAFLVPGFGGAALARAEAFRLRMRKYEWLESLPEGAARKPVPWKRLLADDEERLGKRTLRNLIFPWKD
ncbi:MAG: hypothetical protein JXA15_00170 [Spirochaetales bacterium]|nr:hypothetical protein [Spirochaetales bacterium]